MKQLTKICWHLICSPIHPRLLRRGRFKPCFEPGYFLLQLSNFHDGDLHAVGWGLKKRIIDVRGRCHKPQQVKIVRYRMHDGCH